MTRLRTINTQTHAQRGSVLTWFAVLLPVLLGFVALAVDLARLYLVKTELQNAADAAALAGARVYASSSATDSANAKAEAQAMAQSNGANGIPITDATIDTGYVTPSDPDKILHATDTGGDWLAVRVKIEMSGTSPGPLKNGGALIFFFAPLLSIIDPSLGMASSDVHGTAIAVYATPPGHSRLVK
jgi:type II secretory pathway pseudopilin PulG